MIVEEDAARLQDPVVPREAFARARDLLPRLFDAIPTMTRPLVSDLPGKVHLAWALLTDDGRAEFFMLEVTSDAVKMDGGPKADTEAELIETMRALRYGTFGVHDNE